MTGLLKKATVVLLVLVLVGTFGFGCGGGGGEGGGKITITIGEMTDLTGVASPALVPGHYAFDDMVKYFNEKGLIPGVKLRLASWDTQWNPARDIPGYEWLKERGAKLIVTLSLSTVLTVKPSLERDNVAIASLTASTAMWEPLGNVFAFSNTTYSGTKTLVKWLVEHDWDTSQRIPKIGMIGWNDPMVQEAGQALKDYSQDHPGQFEYVGGYSPPIGTYLLSGEIEKLKECDYIFAQGNVQSDFISQFRGKGYNTKFVNYGDAPSWRDYLIKKCGWESLDGFLTGYATLGWNESTPSVDLAKELLRRYHPGEADDIIRNGYTYTGISQEIVAVLEILKAAIQKVGAQNFDGRAFCDAALEYKTEGSMWEGYPQYSFSETKRYLMDDIALYKFDAAAQDLVRIGDWLPLVTE